MIGPDRGDLGEAAWLDWIIDGAGGELAEGALRDPVHPQAWSTTSPLPSHPRGLRCTGHLDGAPDDYAALDSAPFIGVVSGDITAVNGRQLFQRR